MLICAVCTANTCRSPMAEALLRRAFSARGLDDVGVCSAGVLASRGSPATGDAVDAMLEYGADISAHRSRSVKDVPDDALFLCMTSAHLRALKSALPNSNARLFLEYAGEKGEVSDPYMMGIAAYRALAARMERAANAIADRISRGE